MTEPLEIDGALIHLGDPEKGAFVATPSHADLIAQIPEGMPVKMEVDVATGLFRYVALTPDELALRDVDEKAAAVAEAEAQVVADERDVLVAKLASGKATDIEVQQALAQVIR